MPPSFQGTKQSPQSSQLFVKDFDDHSSSSTDSCMSSGSLDDGVGFEQLKDMIEKPSNRNRFHEKVHSIKIENTLDSLERLETDPSTPTDKICTTGSYIDELVNLRISGISELKNSPMSPSVDPNSSLLRQLSTPPKPVKTPAVAQSFWKKCPVALQPDAPIPNSHGRRFLRMENRPKYTTRFKRGLQITMANESQVCFQER